MKSSAMSQMEALNLLEEATSRLRRPQANENGGYCQLGGIYWRLCSVLKNFVLPNLDDIEGIEHADFLKKNHGNEPSQPEANKEATTEMVRLVAIEELPIGKSCVYDLEKAGKFPKRIKVGRRSFWRSDEIANWIEQRSASRNAQK